MKNVLTKEAFAEWCEKHPADEFYDYWHSGNCACGQYAKHIGLFGHWLGNSHTPFWMVSNDKAAVFPHTFGALASRLRGAA